MKATFCRTIGNLEKFVEMFGGEENMKQKYKRTYEAYLNTISPKSQKAWDNEKSVNIDVNTVIMGIGYTDSTKKEIYIDITSDVSLASPEPSEPSEPSEPGEPGKPGKPSEPGDNAALYLNIVVVDSVSGEVISPTVSEAKFVGNSQSAHIRFPADARTPDKLKTVNVLYRVKDSVEPYIFDESLDIYTIGYSGKYTIKHPVRTRGEDISQPINVAFYDKRLAFWDGYDYFYDKSDIGGGLDVALFTLESEGFVDVEGTTLKEFNSAEITYTIDGIKQPHGGAQGSGELENDKCIRWKFPKNACFKYTEGMANVHACTGIGYDLSIVALTTENRKALFHVTNLPDYYPQGDKHFINTIQMKTDCFFKGTSVTMADGSQRLIESLKEGEMVLTRNGGTAKILSCGNMRTLVPSTTVTTSDGTSVKTTPGHPFVTVEGLRYAYLLQVGEELFTKDGKTTITQVETSPAENVDLYFVGLDYKNADLYVNGLLVGDSFAVLSREEEDANWYYRISEEWREDYANWNKQKFFAKQVRAEAAVVEKYSLDSTLISDIEEVAADSYGDDYIYTVVPKKPCRGNIKIIISKAMNYSPEHRLETFSQWSVSCGEVRLHKSLVRDSDYLYMYLYDEDSRIHSGIVNIYSAPLTVKKWVLTDDAIVFFPDRKVAAFDLATGLAIMYTDSQPHYKICETVLPDTKFEFYRMEIWRETESFTCALQFHIKANGVDIYSAPSDDITVYVAPPAISGVSYCKNKLTASGEFIKGASLGADLLADGIFVRKLEALGAYEFYLDRTGLGGSGVYSVSFYYETALGVSYKTAPISLVTAVPIVSDCYFRENKVVITLDEKADYAITGDKIGIRKFTGDRVDIPESAGDFAIRVIKGISSGEPVPFQPECPAFYPMRYNGEIFYGYNRRPYKSEKPEDQEIPLGLEIKTYEGGFFRASDRLLTIKGNIYNADSEAVRKDYLKMLKANGADPNAVRRIRNAVANYMPMRSTDMLFYHYGFSPDKGHSEVFEGMSLLVEYASQPRGFVGAGEARYSVINRGGKLTFDSFASLMEFNVEPPAPIKGDNKLDGGAGLADLLYEGFRASHMGLAYPVVFTGRTDDESLVYTDNVCLMSSDNWNDLQEALLNMRARTIPVEGVMYNYFRGRSIITPQIMVHVNGCSQWISLGTTLGDVMNIYGKNKISGVALKRQADALVPVYAADENMPLLMGDRIDI